VLHLSSCVFFLLLRRPRLSTLFPYTTLFRSDLSRSQRQSRFQRRHHLVVRRLERPARLSTPLGPRRQAARPRPPRAKGHGQYPRSEEHTSELQSRGHLVCRLLLEKKKNTSPH